MGFVDTLPLFKKSYPEFPNHKLGTLNNMLLPTGFQAHNACEDVNVLKRVCNVSESLKENLIHHSFSVQDVSAGISQDYALIENLPSLEKIISEKALSKGMAERTAKSGLNFRYLKLACNRKGLDGIQELFAELDCNGQVRVTKNKKIVKKLFEFVNSK